MPRTSVKSKDVKKPGQAAKSKSKEVGKKRREKFQKSRVDEDDMPTYDRTHIVYTVRSALEMATGNYNWLAQFSFGRRDITVEVIRDGFEAPSYCISVSDTALAPGGLLAPAALKHAFDPTRMDDEWYFSVSTPTEAGLAIRWIAEQVFYLSNAEKADMTHVLTAKFKYNKD